MSPKNKKDITAFDVGALLDSVRLSYLLFGVLIGTATSVAVTSLGLIGIFIGVVVSILGAPICMRNENKAREKFLGINE